VGYELRSVRVVAKPYFNFIIYIRWLRIYRELLPARQDSILGSMAADRTVAISLEFAGQIAEPPYSGRSSGCRFIFLPSNSFMDGV